MSLEAGSVYTILGGKFNAEAYGKFDAANKQAVASATRAEGEMAASAGRLARAQNATAESHHRAARAAEDVRRQTGHMIESSAFASLDRWEKSSRKASKAAKELGSFGAKGAAVGLATLTAATGYAIYKSAEFERQMRNVNSIAKLNEGQYHSLSKSVLDLSGEVAQAPHVLAEGLYQLVSSGFNASDSLIILRASAKAATAGLTDTETAAKAVVAVLNAYRLPATEASHVSDILFETVNRGVLTFEELSKEIGTVLPFASALNVPLKDVGAAISTMTKEGISAPETMTRIKQAMVSIIKPSKDMKAAIKDTGASSGQALVQQKGFQGALEALVKTTHGSRESLAKLFPNIRALGGVLALTGKNARAAQTDIKAFQDTTGATAGVFREQAKSASFAGKELLAQLESAAIVVGAKFLPILASGAHDLVSVLKEAAADGTLENLANSTLHLFSALGQGGADLVHGLAPIAGVLYNIGAALSGLASASGLDLGGQLAAMAAAFITFKAASTIGPILIGLADGIQAVGLAAATAPSIGAFIADLSALGVLVPGIGLALAAAVGGFVAIESGMFHSASAAEKDAAALRDVKKATEELKAATTEAAKAEQQVRRTELEKKRADREVKEARQRHKEGKGSQLEVEEAENRASEAGLQKTVALEERRKKISKERTEAEAKSNTSAKRHEEIQGEITALEKQAQLYGTTNHVLANGKTIQTELNRLRQEGAQQARIEQQAIAEAAVAEVSRLRLSHGVKEPGIKPQNAQAVNQLQIALSAIPTSVRLKFELADQGTMAKLGTLSHQLEVMGQGTTMVKILTTAPSASAALVAMRAVVAGVPSQKVIRILHNAGSAKQKMDELNAAVRGLHGKNVPISTSALQARLEVLGLQGAINGLVGKTVTVTVNTINKALKFAAGRPDGQAQAAIVGEGRGPEYIINSRTGTGYKTPGPMLTGLSADDYVIPLEDRYRGRALGLFAMLAKDLGVPGYKKGKKGGAKSGHPMPVPDAIQPLSIPLSDIESKQSKAKSAYDKWHSSASSLNARVATAERDLKYAKTGPTKAKDRQKLQEAQRKLRHAKTEEAKRHKELQAWDRTLAEAKSYAAKIKHAETEVANDRNLMAAAANHGDYAAYSAAKGKRLSALGVLQGLARQALKVIKPGSQYALEIEGQLQGYQAETEAGEAEEPPALTADQERQRKQLEANIALAALTPGLTDDTSAAQQLVSFFESALSTAQARGAGPEAITELAQDVKNARSNLESLTTGGAENSNSDLQAQLNQRTEQLEVERRRADIAEGARGVLSGPGDIGQGGPTAAAAVIQKFEMVFPPTSPDHLRAIGDAAVGGMSYQGGRQSPRTQVGPR